MPQAVDRDRDAVAQSDLELRRGRTRRGDASARLFAGGKLGWTEDRNVRVEIRWGGGDPAKHRRYAEELVSLPANVIMVTGNAGLEALLRATRSVPIVFHSVADPVGSGFVESLARAGGNATGFIQFEFAITLYLLPPRLQ
jgi:ABC transporter substrate binding protein